MVAIAGMADARYLVDSFAARVGVGPATADVLAQRFARRVVPDMPEPYARVDAVARPLPADVPLLVVHDRGDREVAASESLRLHAAHGDRSRLVLTDGAGHARVLGADATLDAVTAFATGGLPALDRAGTARRACPRHPPETRRPRAGDGVDDRREIGAHSRTTRRRAAAGASMGG